MIAAQRTRFSMQLAAALAATLVVACGGDPGGNGDDDPVDATTIDSRDTTGDEDNDGIPDVDEGRYDPGGPPDHDGDGTPDWQDTDSDADGLSDLDEGTDDFDGDGDPNYIDPFNDGTPGAITLTAISTTFNSPIGIDYHEPTNTVVMSVNYPTGLPTVIERVEADGDHQPHSLYSGLTEETKIGTVRSGNVGGFVAGELFIGSGTDGHIVKVSPDGSIVTNPWVDLPGTGNGLIRGSFHVDRTGIYGGDLIICTTLGEVWRITSAGVPTLIDDVGDVHFEGLYVVPNVPVRYGPLAGKIIAGAEAVGLLYAFDATGEVAQYNLGVAVEDIDLVNPRENFFGVNFGSSRLLGASAEDMQSVVGDILLTQESIVAGVSGLYRLNWDGTTLTAQQVPLSATSVLPAQWEHVTMAPAGIVEIPPVD